MMKICRIYSTISVPEGAGCIALIRSKDRPEAVTAVLPGRVFHATGEISVEMVPIHCGPQSAAPPG